MVDTCHVTGVVISPDGNPVPRATVRFQRLPHEVFVEDDKTGIPREVRAEADEDGNIAVDLIPGEYKVIIIARGYNQYPPFNVGVPDQPTAVLADIQDVPPPPPLDDATRAVRDAREARDEAREARDEAVVSAQAAADAAQAAEGHATAAAASAQAAADSEQAAATSAGNAATSASNAAASATAAGNSASAAATSEQNAAASAQAAADSASAASASANNAADAQQAAEAAAQTATEVAEALPDPEGAASGQLVETDGADGFRLVSPDELRISRALQAVAGTARDLVFFDTFQRAPGPIGISDSGHTWIDHVDALQNGDVAWVGASDRHRSMVVGEFGAAPSGSISNTTAAMATVENELVKDSIVSSGSGFTLTAHITNPINAGIIPVYFDNQTAIILAVSNSSRSLTLSLWDDGSETVLAQFSSQFSRNDVGNSSPAMLSASVLRRGTSRLRINIHGSRDEVVIRDSVDIVESDNPTLFAKLINPAGFGIIHGGGSGANKYFRRVSIERFEV